MRLAALLDRSSAQYAPWLSTACAIVPLYPKELTPPTLCGPGSSTPWAGSSKPTSEDASSLGSSLFRIRNCALADSAWCESERLAFNNPRCPATGSEWPMLALLAPMAFGDAWQS